jgi:uncharacterized protein (DUF2236 family)
VWEHFGRQPVFRLSNGLREAMLQNMHPGLAAGVEHHSVFFEDPRARGERSIGPIMSVVYGGSTSHEWGKVVRGFHGSIKGVDKYGRRYSALNPETFFWAHATFVEDIVTGHELTGYPLSAADKEALLSGIDRLVSPLWRQHEARPTRLGRIPAVLGTHDQQRARGQPPGSGGLSHVPDHAAADQ